MTRLLVIFLLLIFCTSLTECQIASTIISTLANYPLWLYQLVFGQSLTDATIPKDVLEEISMDPIGRINRNGLTAELHVVKTIDGYNLNVYRIPNNSTDAIPVLLMHGVASCCEAFISDLADSPAFLMHKGGFDVWMGNWRGGPYTNHTTLTPDDPEYWNFSLDDLADKDAPPMLDYVLEKTGKSRIIYAGHSMGTIIGFCLFSSHSEYNDKVSTFLALSAVPSIRYTTAPGAPLVSTSELTMPLLEATGQYSVGAMDNATLSLLLAACASNHELCEFFMSLVCGWNPYYHNQTRLPVYVSIFRPGTSTKILKHLGQATRLNAFHRFDYGRTENLKRYNMTIPPKYDLTAIKIPTLMYSGPNDAPSDAIDISYAIQGVSVATWYVVNRPMYSHADSLYSLNNGEALYNRVMDNAKQSYSL